MGLLLISCGSGPATIPYDLPQAVVDQFEALADTVLDGFTAIYKDQAGDQSVLPYLVYSIKRGPLDFISSTSTWHNDKVCFRAWAASGDDAEDFLPDIRTAYNDQSLIFATGCTTAFVEADRGSGKGPGRGPGQRYIYFASIEFMVRTRTGLPT